MKLALMFLAGVATVFGCTPSTTGSSTIISTGSCAEVDTIVTTPVTQRVDTFSTELRARIGNGAFLYDQTFHVAFGDPTVQTAITSARGVLSGAGAVNFSGPTQLSNSQSLVSSTTSTVTTGTQTTQNIVTTQAWVGPQTITVGQWGICQSYAWGGLSNVAPTLTGCVPGGTAFPIVAGGTVFDTLQVALVNVSQTATTTNTFLTTQIYELDGFAAGVPVTPAPPALLLVVTALLCAGLFLLMQRRRA